MIVVSKQLAKVENTCLGYVFHPIFAKEVALGGKLTPVKSGMDGRRDMVFLFRYPFEYLSFLSGDAEVSNRGPD